MWLLNLVTWQVTFLHLKRCDCNNVLRPTLIQSCARVGKCADLSRATTRWLSWWFFRNVSEMSFFTSGLRRCQKKSLEKSMLLFQQPACNTSINFGNSPWKAHRCVCVCVEGLMPNNKAPEWDSGSKRQDGSCSPLRVKTESWTDRWRQTGSRQGNGVGGWTGKNEQPISSATAV